ncbi:YebC/PmpR family DNA-binding transcriptional regulator [bacterium]|nr:YebC/PmpR family DNA-binding transcriptional regulator [bacterium]
MSGHSKWSTIKRQKGAKDAARGALFTRLGNGIAIAARNGTDPDTNFSLRIAMDKAREANMPQANIQRSIDRIKDKSLSDLTEALYEGYGPGGVAILVEVATDNINRTYPEVRLAFTKHGGNIAEKNSVAFMFDRRGLIRIKGSGDELMLEVLDAGAIDVVEENGELIIYTKATDLAAVRDKLSKDHQILDAELTYVPNMSVEVSDQTTVNKIMNLMEALEDNADVTNTYVNFDIKDDLINETGN